MTTVELTAYWSRMASELSHYLGVVPNVLQDDVDAYAFLLGNHEVLRVANRTTYIHVSYVEWGPGQPELRTNQYHGSIVEAVKFVTPQVIDNLNEYKQTAKLLGLV
jgi:hypothetical protein